MSDLTPAPLAEALLPVCLGAVNAAGRLPAEAGFGAQATTRLAQRSTHVYRQLIVMGRLYAMLPVTGHQWTVADAGAGPSRLTNGHRAATCPFDPGSC